MILRLILIVYFFLGGNHWICISCKSFNSKRPSVNVLDSLGLLTELNSATILEIANLIHTNQSFFSIKKLSVSSSKLVLWTVDFLPLLLLLSHV